MTGPAAGGAAGATTKSAGAGGGADDEPRTPLPPADLDARDVEPLVVAPRELLRIHWPGHALYFGPDVGKPPAGRFDAPGGEYRVHYSGHTFTAAFLEAILRQGHPPILAWSDLIQREVSVLATTRPLRVMPLHGDWLPALDATAAVASGPYRPSRQWGLALWNWRRAADPAGTLDGIQYPSRHNDDHRCLALFDHAASALGVVSTESLATRLADILALQRRYRTAFALDLDT